MLCIYTLYLQLFSSSLLGTPIWTYILKIGLDKTHCEDNMKYLTTTIQHTPTCHHQPPVPKQLLYLIGHWTFLILDILLTRVLYGRQQAIYRLYKIYRHACVLHTGTKYILNHSTILSTSSKVSVPLSPTFFCFVGTWFSNWFNICLSSCISTLYSAYLLSLNIFWRITSSFLISNYRDSSVSISIS